MSKTTTFQTLLDKAETPLQTHIILAQLQIMRKLDRDRQGNALPVVLLGLIALAIWMAASVVAAGHIGQALGRVIQ